MPINLDPRADPTIYRRGDQNTTLKETVTSVSQAYDSSIDALNALLKLSIELRTNGAYHTAQSYAVVEQYIERMKSVLESENLRFYYMAKAIESTDKVEKLRAWKDMNKQDVELALLKKGEEQGDEARKNNMELTKWVIGEYGLKELWAHAELRDELEVTIDDIASFQG